MNKLASSILLILFLLCSNVSNSETIAVKINNHIDQLNSESILTVYRDSKGYLWVGTYMGLFRSDGSDHYSYEHNPNDPNSISASNIYTIYEDSKNNLWIGSHKGLNKYNYDTDNFTLHIPKANDPDWIYKEMRDITEDDEGNLWLATYNHSGLIKYNPNTNTDTTFWLPNYNEHRLNALEFFNGNLYVGTELGGLFTFNTQTNKSQNLIYTNKYGTPLTINDLLINDSVLFIGTWSNGLISYNITTQNIKWYNPLNTDKAFTPQNNVRNIAIDNDKNLWLAIFKGGLKKLNLKTGKLTSIVNTHDNQADSKNYRSWAIHIDNDEILWLGTNETGIKKLFLKSTNSSFLSYKENGLWHQVSNVTDAILDKKNNVWIATQTHSLLKYNIEHNSVVKINLGEQNKDVLCVSYDSLNRVWASTNEGIFLVDATSNNVLYNLANQNNYFRNTIKTPYFMYTDRDGDVWMGAWQTGLIRLPKKQMQTSVSKYRPIKYTANENSNNSITSNSIIGVYQSTNGTIWISGSYYMQKFNKSNNSFELISWFDAANMTEDCNNNLWIASNSEGLLKYDISQNHFTDFGKEYPGQTHGVGIFNDSCSIWFPRKNDLIKINPSNGEIKVFNHHSGIKPMNQSNSNLITKNGTVFLAGNEGSYLFHPSIREPKASEILLANLFIYNKQIKVNDTINNKIILSKSLNHINKLTIPANTKSFSIEFSSFNFANPNKTIFAYKVDGFDTTWNMLEYPNKMAVLNNLEGGNYILQYTIYNPFIDWKKSAKQLEIKVITPYYKSTWFKFLIILGILSFIVMFFVVRQKRLNAINIQLEKLVTERTFELQHSNEELKVQTEQLNIANTKLLENQDFINNQNEEIKLQKDELQKNNDQLTEMNETKTKFFSIIAHDLKSPLGSITGLLDLLKEGYESFSNEQIKKMINESYNSSSTVLKLVENLLYWARSISGNIEFNPQIADMNKIIKNNVKIALLTSREKNISINHLNIDTELHCSIDSDMINFTVRNFISNAIKFTPIDGEINVKAELQHSHIVVQVQDSGIGIHQDKINDIFKISSNLSTRGTNNEKGTGLGLALCKDFIEKHGGKIWINSEIDKGSTFYFSIPLSTLNK